LAAADGAGFVGKSRHGGLSLFQKSSEGGGDHFKLGNNLFQTPLVLLWQENKIVLPQK